MERIDGYIDEAFPYTLSTGLHTRLHAKQKSAWGDTGIYGHILAELLWTLEFRVLGQLCYGRQQRSGPNPGIAGELM